jgi:hypothetical protein
MPKALQLGPVTLTTGADTPLRIALLLWGDFGVGKTTFAATAPGRKLWLSIDPDGYAAIAHRKDVIVADIATLDNDTFFTQMQNENPFNLDKFLSENHDIETVVLDSATSLRDRALHKAVDMGIGRSKKEGFVPTIEAPGMSAYGGRNQIVLECISGLLRTTARHGVHCIVTAHEADPERDTQGVVLHITMALGGQLYLGMGYRLSEIWYISQSTTGDKQRRIAVRPTRLRRPMKTRMFQDADHPEFTLRYDAAKPDGKQDTIAKWFDAWHSAKGAKIPLPK